MTNEVKFSLNSTCGLLFLAKTVYLNHNDKCLPSIEANVVLEVASLFHGERACVFWNMYLVHWEHCSSTSCSHWQSDRVNKRRPFVLRYILSHAYNTRACLCCLFLSVVGLFTCAGVERVMFSHWQRTCRRFTARQDLWFCSAQMGVGLNLDRTLLQAACNMCVIAKGIMPKIMFFCRMRNSWSWCKHDDVESFFFISLLNLSMPRACYKHKLSASAAKPGTFCYCKAYKQRKLQRIDKS